MFERKKLNKQVGTPKPSNTNSVNMGKKKKQRLTTDAETEPESNPINGNIDDSHSNKKLKKIKKNKTNEEIPTVSIAVPASIIDNVPTLELATRVPISKLLSFPSQKH